MSMKVLLKAYLTGNVGDDLMVRVLCQRYPNVRFTVVGRKCYKKGFEDIKNLDYITSDTLFHKAIGGALRLSKRSNLFGYAEILLLTRKFDAYVIIGGSMFIEPKDAKKKYLVDKLWLKKKPFIVGCNFGPYSSSEFFSFYKHYFANCKGITTRERATFDLFHDLGNITWAPDLVFSLEEEVKNISINNNVVISVIGYEKTGMVRTEYIQLLKIIVNIVREAGYNPILMSFCKSEGDEVVIDDLLKQTEGHIQSIRYSGANIKEILEAIQSAYCVVAGRFHAMILALLYHKRCLPIVYSSKMEHVLSDILFSDPVHILSAESNDIDMSVLKSENYYVINEKYVEESDKQFCYLDAIWNK